MCPILNYFGLSEGSPDTLLGWSHILKYNKINGLKDGVKGKAPQRLTDECGTTFFLVSFLSETWISNLENLTSQ